MQRRQGRQIPNFADDLGRNQTGFFKAVAALHHAVPDGADGDLLVLPGRPRFLKKFNHEFKSGFMIGETLRPDDFPGLLRTGKNFMHGPSFCRFADAFNKPGTNGGFGVHVDKTILNGGTA